MPRILIGHNKRGIFLKELRDSLQELYDEGLNATDIAKIFKTTIQTVINHGKKLGISFSGNRFGKVSSKRRIAYAKASGWPEYLPISQMAILNVLARLGIPAKSKEVANLLKVSRTFVTRSMFGLVECGRVVRLKIGKCSGYVLSFKALEELKNGQEKTKN